MRAFSTLKNIKVLPPPTHSNICSRALLMLTHGKYKPLPQCGRTLALYMISYYTSYGENRHFTSLVIYQEQKKKFFFRIYFFLCLYKELLCENPNFAISYSFPMARRKTNYQNPLAKYLPSLSRCLKITQIIKKEQKDIPSPHKWKILLWLRYLQSQISRLNVSAFFN